MSEQVNSPLEAALLASRELSAFAKNVNLSLWDSRPRTVDETALAAADQTPPREHIDIVFDGSPGQTAPRFVEAEDANGNSITLPWHEREGGQWALRVSVPPSPQESVAARMVKLVTVKLPKNAAHDPKNKVTGACPVSTDCTDVTGEHHTLVAASDAELQELLERFGHITRIENVALPQLLPGMGALELAKAAYRVDSVHQIFGTQCLCGFESARSRSRTEHITEALLDELQGSERN